MKAEVVNNSRARAVVFGLALGLVLMLAVNARPAQAHTHAQLHAALSNLRDANAAQTRRINSQATQIRALRNRLAAEEQFTNDVACLMLDSFASTWDNLNAEPNIIFDYPMIDPCTTVAASSLEGKAADVLRMALGRHR